MWKTEEEKPQIVNKQITNSVSVLMLVEVVKK